MKTEEIIRRLKLLVIAVLACLALWGLWAMKQSWDSSKNEKAFAALAPADLIEIKVVRDSAALSETEKARDPIEILQSQGFESQKNEYVQTLQAVIADHSGTSAARVAALRLGRLYSNSSDWQAAQTVYSDMLKHTKSTGDQAVFFALGAEALSSVYENQSQWDEALKVLDQALKNTSVPLKPVLMLSQARVLAQSGKKEEAVKVYESLSKDFPNTPYSQQAKALSVKVSL